jgi:hypothetical protein
MLFYIIIDNAPLSASTLLPVDEANNKPWLFTLNMTSATPPALKAMVGNGELRKMGFGVGGYCEWDWSESTGNANCHPGLGWRVRNSTDVTDTAQYAGLPR